MKRLFCQRVPIPRLSTLASRKPALIVHTDSHQPPQMGARMHFSLHVDRDSDGKFSATISGIGDDGREFSARSPNNDEAKVAVARSARLVSLHHPLFGTNLESPTGKRL